MEGVSYVIAQAIMMSEGILQELDSLFSVAGISFDRCDQGFGRGCQLVAAMI